MDKIILIISGPSGVGKTTICNKFLEEYKNFYHPISVTTRQPRDYEINGKHYNFVTEEQYEEMQKKDQLLESVSIYGNKYGTQSLLVESQLSQHNLLFNVDAKGMLKIKEYFKDKANVVTIFILPPSIESLSTRIQLRGDDVAEVQARNERALHEIKHAKNYDYIIMNDKLAVAEKQFFAIYEVLKLNLERQNLLNFFK